MKSKLRVAIVTNVIPQYREDMYRRLVEYYKDNLHIYCQNKIPGMNLNIVNDKFSDYLTSVKYLTLSNEKLSFQFLPISRLLKNHDVIFFSGNPRVLSSVLFATLCRMLGKKVVVWGQYHTAGSISLFEKIRLYWWRLFDYVFLYTDMEARQYLERFGSSQKVIGMNNGLNQDDIDKVIKTSLDDGLEDWAKDNYVYGKKLILSCARLEKKNKFDLFVECLPALLASDPDIIWCVIGKGTEEESLKKMAKRLGVDINIIWLGAIYEQDALAPWFLYSKALVHPGAIGLSLLHSMGYGLPVLTHNNIGMHMPEISAFKEGVNGLFFKENDKQSIIETVLRIINDENLASKLSENATLTARNEYNTKIMADRFIKISEM